MPDKDLTIRIKSVGADAAAAEIDKIPDAIEDIPKSAPSIDTIPRGFGKIPDKVKPAVEAINQIPAALEDIAQTAPKAVDAIAEIPAAIDEISNTAPKAVDSIFAIEDAAKNAARELDVMAAKQRLAEKGSGGKTPGILDTDVSAAAGAAGQKVAEMAGFGAQFRAVSKAISLDAVAVGSSVALVGKVAMESYQLVTSTVERYKQLMVEAKAAGQAIRPELEQEVRALEALMGPLKSAVDAVGGAWEKTKKVFSDPVGELSGLNDLKDSLDEAKAANDRLNAARLKLADSNLDKLAEIYSEEGEELLKQEATLRRIAGVRSELGALKNQAASQDVESARLRGGDVALAEYNALATQLQTGLAALGDKLRSSQASADTARNEFNAASTIYEEALKNGIDKLDPAQFSSLNTALETARTALDGADQAVTDQQQIFAAGKENLLRGAENELAKLDTEAKAALSAEAKKASDAIYQTIKDQFATGPTAAIAQIEVAAGAVTTAATEKAGQVKASIDGERSGTVTAIQGLAPPPQQTQAIVSAVQATGKAYADQSNAIIAALAAVQAGISQMANRFQQQQAQINQLFQRLR